jgi:signal transduction histidine kinase
VRMWFRGKPGGFIAFLAIATMVIGGLGWVTAAALRLENEQFESQAEARVNEKLRLAMWRLDSRIAPLLAREDSRPFTHFKPLFAPALALTSGQLATESASVLEPSPLLSAELPEWMLLHFQTDNLSNWGSPQVPTAETVRRLGDLGMPLNLLNITPQRQNLLAELKNQITVATLLAFVRQRGEQHNLVDTANAMTRPDIGLSPQAAQQMAAAEYFNRAGQQNFLRNTSKNEAQQGNSPVEDNPAGSRKKANQTPPVKIVLGSMVALWTLTRNQGDRLIFARDVQIGSQVLCQGILLDWNKLQLVLAEEVNDLFPDARFLPMKEVIPSLPERTMTALPVELQPGMLAVQPSIPSWTPLRMGLAMSWAAALLALLAVGLGGWSLIDLSERRIRFVSAVTHELRTPLTTLRLYLDMLSGGMIKDANQKEEYLQTLNAEADRLNRLVGNVLDFSRLERQRPRLAKTEMRLGDFLDQVAAAWQDRCRNAGKDLVVENTAGEDMKLFTDIQIAQQIVGNLIDNACKYSQDASDRRLWLRAFFDTRQSLIVEVEDRGPGVPPRERRSIFRPFQRGKNHDVVAGGVGLGLALALRWAHLLDGSLTLQSGNANGGARFRLTLPVESHPSANR